MHQLSMSLQQSIWTLADRGWSNRRIARELGVDRDTVSRWRRRSPPNAAKVTLGSADGSPGPNAAKVTAGSEPAPTASPSPSGPPVPATNGDARSRSSCTEHTAQIQAGIAAGLTAQRIFQDLVADAGFAGSYQAVKRFVRRFRQEVPIPFRRIEVAPGAEAQIDFGTAAPITTPEGESFRPHLLRVVLSHSRKAYSEVFRRQTTENFIRGLENAFRALGGVPATLVIDNLKAAVRRVDWFDPDLNPKVREFAAHYGTVFLPTKPAMPRHKGKVEAGVKYAQSNALRGRRFASVAEQNHFLADWERTVADTRIHGTIRQQVGRLFEAVERPALKPLPDSLFPVFVEAPRTVHRDGHVAFEHAYYSVPPEYVGANVWVRADLRLVRIFNQRMEPIALHTRHEPGRFATDPAHIHSHKRRIVERGVEWMLQRAALVGTATGTWANSMYRQRGVEGVRVLQGLLALVEKHPPGQVERACARALEAGGWHLRDVREALDAPSPQVQFDFLAHHELIRPLDHYERLTPDCFDTP